MSFYDNYDEYEDEFTDYSTEYDEDYEDEAPEPELPKVSVKKSGSGYGIFRDDEKVGYAPTFADALSQATTPESDEDAVDPELDSALTGAGTHRVNLDSVVEHPMAGIAALEREAYVLLNRLALFESDVKRSDYWPAREVDSVDINPALAEAFRQRPALEKLFVQNSTTRAVESLEEGVALVSRLATEVGRAEAEAAANEPEEDEDFWDEEDDPCDCDDCLNPEDEDDEDDPDYWDEIHRDENPADPFDSGYPHFAPSWSDGDDIEPPF